uniref:Protein ERGIC-53 n=1 Tax=Callorhinchus milii TaxID=7868 RepID=V9KKZ4_CALMI
MAAGRGWWWWLAVACLLLAVAGAPAQAQAQSGELPHRRFEYKYSFKGPQLTLDDGTVRFWTHYGSALPSSERVRVAPSLRSQKGSIWTQNKVTFEDWEIEVAFRISGLGRIGADGLAIWYTKERGPTGPVFGAMDNWDGVGIFFDTFDNDDGKNNPIILLMENNGKLTYDHSNDGLAQGLGSCIRDVRNSYHAVRVKISYYRKTLQVYLNLGNSVTDESYELCIQVKNLIVPSGGYFGVSAATGGIADDHDVLSFVTFSLTEPGKQDPSNQMLNKDLDEYQKEYERFEKDLEKRKDEYQKQHPETHTPDEDVFETQGQRELQMVLDGQSVIQSELKRLGERLKVMFEGQKQNSEFISHAGGKRSTTTVVGEAEQGDVGSKSLESMLKNQKELVRQVQEMRTSIADIITNVKLHQKSLNAESAEPGHFLEIKEHIYVVKKDVDSLLKFKAQHINCPKVPLVPPCTSAGHFLVFIVLQSIFVIYYLMYRSKRQADFKKFF